MDRPSPPPAFFGGTVKLLNQKGQPIESIQTHQGSVSSVSWSSDGQTLATASLVDGTVKLWNQKGQSIESIQAHQSAVLSVSWSSDGQTLATAGENSTVKLWNQKGQPIESIQTHQGSVSSVSWSSDGQTLATAGTDGTVKLWNQKGQPIESIQTHQGSVSRVSWSPNGQTLATGGYDGTVKLWPIKNLETLLEKGCNWLDRYLITTPQELQKLKVCQTPTRRLEAATYLIDYSEQLAKNGQINEAIQGFKDTLQWDPRLNFDPETRATELAQEAKQNK
ncbi:hypothetical protein HRE53_30050 (plasmid) [Acaryochloris sp. 'Moss Beach']|uniref:WD40 repeat domain-containing protein n=1 Tax=Acaryochloris sp. 'Moss Beach' TaxID=2740837 RepID=UPI001F47395D|nr:hypothetical protein [Acaryochloris sp. 'Moss Beach']UJB72977.1 hypothetical protein HRE53_30050 [Acaryochloris sp. 'Moss Beach']